METPYAIGPDKDFLHRSMNALATKEINGQVGLHQIYKLSIAKELVNSVKTQLTEWEKIFVNYPIISGM